MVCASPTSTGVARRQQQSPTHPSHARADVPTLRGKLNEALDNRRALLLVVSRQKKELALAERDAEARAAEAAQYISKLEQCVTSLSHRCGVSPPEF